MSKKRKNIKKKSSILIKKINKKGVDGIKGIGVKKKRKYTKRKGVRYGRPIRYIGMPKSKPNKFILFKNRVFKLIKEKPYALPYFNKRFTELIRLLWEKKKQYEKTEKVPFNDSEIIYFSDEFFGASKQVSVLLDTIKNKTPYSYYDIEELLERLSLVEANLKIHIQEFTTKKEFIFPHEIVREERKVYEQYFQSWVAWANLVHISNELNNTDKIRMFVKASDWCYDEENDYYHIEIVLCDVNGDPNSFGFYPNDDEYYTLDDYKDITSPNIVITEICNCNKKLYTKINEKGEEKIYYEKPDFSNLKDNWEWCTGGKGKETEEEVSHKEEKEIENERLKQEKAITRKLEAEAKESEIHEITSRIIQFIKLVKDFEGIGDKNSADEYREKIKKAKKELDKLT